MCKPRKWSQMPAIGNQMKKHIRELCNTKVHAPISWHYPVSDQPLPSSPHGISFCPHILFVLCKSPLFFTSPRYILTTNSIIGPHFLFSSPTLLSLTCPFLLPTSDRPTYLFPESLSSLMSPSASSDAFMLYKAALDDRTWAIDLP